MSGLGLSTILLSLAIWVFLTNTLVSSDTLLLNMSRVSPTLKSTWEVATKLMISSASRTVNTRSHVPQLVREHELVLSLKGLGWNPLDFQQVLSGVTYPYSLETVPTTLDGRWVTHILSDQSDFNAYHLLLHSNYEKQTAPPKNLKELLAFWQVDDKKYDEYEFGYVETNSGVSLQGSRFIASIPTSANLSYWWQTLDVLEINTRKDPLENIDGNFEADGAEYIWSLQKADYVERTRGSLQGYALTNGEGTIIFEATNKLVEDHTRFRGKASIRVPGSCIQCHVEGLNAPTEFGLAEAYDLGTYTKADPLTVEFIQRFHLGWDTKEEITKRQLEYNRGILAVVGKDLLEATRIELDLPPTSTYASVAIRAFKTAIDDYEAPVGLEKAAYELGTDQDTLIGAIGRTAAQGEAVGIRASVLAKGKSIPRKQFEELYVHLDSWISGNNSTSLRPVGSDQRNSGHKPYDSVRSTNTSRTGSPVREGLGTGKEQPNARYSHRDEGVTTSQQCFLRRHNGGEWIPITQLEAGVQLEVVQDERVWEGMKKLGVTSWIPVIYQGTKGWVHKQNLKNVNELPM